MGLALSLLGIRLWGLSYPATPIGVSHLPLYTTFYSTICLKLNWFKTSIFIKKNTLFIFQIDIYTFLLVTGVLGFIIKN
jgi:hypothetical protein